MRIAYFFHLFSSHLDLFVCIISTLLYSLLDCEFSAPLYQWLSCLNMYIAYRKMYEICCSKTLCLSVALTSIVINVYDLAHSSALLHLFQINPPISSTSALSGQTLEGSAPHPLLLPNSLMPSYRDTQKPLMKNICFPTFLTLSKVMDL